MKSSIVLLSLTLLVLTSGCIGVETFEADKPVISNETLNEANYEQKSSETFKVNESREILGSDRGAEIVTHFSLYEKDLSDMNINFTQDQLENTDISSLIGSSDIDVVDVIGEDKLISRIANSSDQYEESDIRFVLDQTDQSIGEFMQSNDIDPQDYINKDEIIESLTAEQVNQIAQNTGDIEGQGSVFFAVSTPSAGVLGTELNPLILGSTEDLIGLVQSRSDQKLEVGDREELTTVEDKDGNAVTVEQYPATIESGGQKINSKLLIGTNEGIEGNLIVTFAIYPEFTDGKDDAIKMIKGTSVEK